MHKQKDFRPGHPPSQQTIKRFKLDKACRNEATGMSLSYAADAPLTYSTLVNIPQRTGRSIGDIQVSSSSALKCLGFSDSYQSVCPSIFSTPIQSRCEMGARGMGGICFFMSGSATESLHPLSVSVTSFSLPMRGYDCRICLP